MTTQGEVCIGEVQRSCNNGTVKGDVCVVRPNACPLFAKRVNGECRLSYPFRYFED